MDLVIPFRWRQLACPVCGGHPLSPTATACAECHGTGKKWVYIPETLEAD